MKRLIVTVGGSGLIPFAPGTFGSLATTIFLAAIYFAAKPGPAAWIIVLLVSLVTASALCVLLGEWGIRHFGREDPPSFVLDEAAGISLTLIGVPIAPAIGPALLTFAVAFVAFRIFDITKPPPARQLEKLPAGWGILLDDLAAAVYANILCQIVLRLI